MKKLIKNTIYLIFATAFCSFLFLSNQPFLAKCFAKDISFTESELKDYQEIEKGVSVDSDKFFEDYFSETDGKSATNYLIVIDAGHGGPDPGSIGYKTKVYEADLNLKISKMLKQKLEDSGISVVMTRETEAALAEGRGKSFKKRDMELRKEIIKQHRPNMVISIHQNSYTNHKFSGAQVFYDKTSDISKNIADKIQEEFIKQLDGSHKSTSPGDYYMLKCTTAPSVIVECGFLSNEKEEQLLLKPEYQEKIVSAIYVGIISFLQTKNL